MCEPVSTSTALMMATTAASGVATMYAQQQQHQAIADSHEVRQEQEQKAAQQKAFERSRQARRERSRIQAQAAVSGIGGSSVSQQLMDSRFQESHDQSNIRANRNMSMQANHAQAESQAAQVGDPTMTGIQTGLNIGSTYYRGTQ